MSKAQAQKTEPIDEPPKRDATGDRKAGGSLLSRLRDRLLLKSSTSSIRKPPLGTFYDDLIEPEFRGELKVIMPTNSVPTKLVIVGCWEDKYPEVILERLESQLPTKEYYVANHNMAPDGD